MHSIHEEGLCPVMKVQAVKSRQVFSLFAPKEVNLTIPDSSINFASNAMIKYGQSSILCMNLQFYEIW